MKKYFLAIIIAIAVFFVIVTGPAVRLYTDLLWFRSLGYGTIFSTILITRILIGLLLGFLFFALVYGNLWYARRIAPISPVSVDNELFERGFRIARSAVGLLLFIGSIVVSAMVGLEAATHWEKWLTYFNPTLFGSTDPLFNRDIGFYVFRLPLLEYIYSWLFFALVVSTVAAAGVHYTSRAIVAFGNRLQVMPRTKVHLSVLIAAMFFLKAWGYRLAMYQLLFVKGSLFDGAGYTELYARLPALWILLVAAIIGGVLVLLGIKRRGITYAVAGLAGLVGLSILVGMLYPAAVQQFSVAPNELDKQTPFIERAIAATREAYGLTGVSAVPFGAELSLTPDQVEANSPTIENIRLWDQDHLLAAYAQIQTIQQYYVFKDVDVDRYWLDSRGGSGKHYRQVWLSARELTQSVLPRQSQTWINKHLTYTHGYGFCMSPVNEVSAEGLPDFFVYDIPPKAKVDIPIEKMGVYFGESTDTYALVDTSAAEFDYPAGTETQQTTYQESGGVGIGTFFRKLLFSVRFSDLNILLNENLKPESRVLYQREIGERVKVLFPFLQFDQDPYLVTVGGNLYWMWDAYTTTSSYPYSKHVQVWSSDCNYIRNSVKLVINAYTGRIDAYVIPKPLKDPLIETYQKIFPGVFKPLSEMPEELRAHIRYPEDMFRIQTVVFARYHMNDPTVFYNNSDLWDVPGRAELIAGGGGSLPMDPYYVIMKLPNGTKEEFILMNPYIRAGKFNMVSWMCAKCDDPDYGRLVLYQFPKETNVFGPQQIAARARQDTVISEQLTLWSQQGSEVGSGNLLVIPIESSLLYVMPVYLQSTSTKIPELKRVIVALGNKVAMAQTLGEALSAVVSSSVAPTQLTGTLGQAAGKLKPLPTLPASPTRISEEVTRMVNQAISQYNKAQEAQKKGDWAAYGEQMNELKQTLKELQSKAK
jgi:hypothetical protein